MGSSFAIRAQIQLFKLFVEYLLKSHYVLGPVLIAIDTMMSKINTIFSFPLEFIFASENNSLLYSGYLLLHNQSPQHLVA